MPKKISAQTPENSDTAGGPDTVGGTETVGYSANLVVLLAALVLLLMIAPLFESWLLGSWSLYGVLTFTLLAAGGLSASKGRLFVVMLVLLAVAVPVLWIGALGHWPAVFVASCVLDSAVCGLLAGRLLLRVARQGPASWQSIAGAVAAYLLLGLSWSMLYWATERVESETLTFANVALIEDPMTGQRVAPFSQMVYFSFVTMSTLGYGDVTPLTPIVRTLAWMQAVTGQFYLAVLVARLVADLRPNRATTDARQD